MCVWAKKWRRVQQTEKARERKRDKFDCVCERENERLRQCDKTGELMSELSRVCKREKYGEREVGMREKKRSVCILCPLKNLWGVFRFHLQHHTTSNGWMLHLNQAEFTNCCISSSSIGYHFLYSSFISYLPYFSVSQYNVCFNEIVVSVTLFSVDLTTFLKSYGKCESDE